MLQDEINKKASEIYKEAYQMSIGELANLYRDDELDIHPEFQRLYRWSDFQKTKLIESIMLNIPIPPIYVSQTEDGIWDVIDGVQRLSTIFQFMGILKDDEGNKVEQLVLMGTKDLPSFEGMKWQDSDPNKSFTREQQLELKRSRIDVTILKKTSDSKTKYELFQRLNTGGTKLSFQEVRNCLIIMENRDFYKFIAELDKNTNFGECVPITDRKMDEQYRIELIVRLLVGLFMDWTLSGSYKEITDLLDQEVLNLCRDQAFNFEEVKRSFNETFEVLNSATQDNSFRKYKKDADKFSGAFLLPAFETIAIGVFYNIDKIYGMDQRNEYILQKVKGLYNEGTFVENTKPGVNVITRYHNLIEFGKMYFNNEQN